jgi:hypothetical protein
VREAAALKKQIAAAEAEIPTTLVMEEQKEMRPTFILMRGAYDKPGEKVAAATPAFCLRSLRICRATDSVSPSGS